MQHARRLLRLVRLLWHFARTSLAAELEYRMNFALAVLSSLGHFVGNLFGLSLFYSGQSSLGGWPLEAALLVMGFFTTLQGLSRALMTPNLRQIVQHVRQGTLDFVLLKPVDSQLWLSARCFSPWGLPDVCFGLGIVAYAGHRLQLAPLDLGLALLALGLALTIQYALWFSLASLSVWFVQVHNVTEVLNGLLAAGRYPIDALPAGAYRFAFTFVVPVALLTSVPARVALGHDVGGWLWVSVLFALGGLVLSRLIWRRALSDYSSASS